jgi:hypothetical protein
VSPREIGGGIEGLMLADGETEADGDTELDGETLELIDELGDTELLILDDGEIELDGEIEALIDDDGDIDGEIDDDGDIDEPDSDVADAISIAIPPISPVALHEASTILSFDDLYSTNASMFDPNGETNEVYPLPRAQLSVWLPALFAKKPKVALYGLENADN